MCGPKFKRPKFQFLTVMSSVVILRDSVIYNEELLDLLFCAGSSLLSQFSQPAVSVNDTTSRSTCDCMKVKVLSVV